MCQFAIADVVPLVLGKAMEEDATVVLAKGCECESLRCGLGSCAEGAA